jgi:hypothetical protein
MLKKGNALENANSITSTVNGYNERKDKDKADGSLNGLISWLNDNGAEINNVIMKKVDGRLLRNVD